MPKILYGFLARLERWLTIVTAFLLAVLTVLICWQVFSRYVLQSSPYWVEEFSVTALMWIGLLGAAAGVWNDVHMNLDILVKRLPAAAKAWLEAFKDACIALFSLYLCVYGYILASETMDSQMSTIPIPLGLSYAVVPIAAAFMILFAAVRAANKLAAHYGKEKGDD